MTPNTPSSPEVSHAPHCSSTVTACPFFARLKQQLLAWNETVEASFAGRDYPAGRVTPPDPEPQAWYDTPAYQPAWKDRWEFKAYLERRNKPEKTAKVKPQ